MVDAVNQKPIATKDPVLAQETGKNVELFDKDQDLDRVKESNLTERQAQDLAKPQDAVEPIEEEIFEEQYLPEKAETSVAEQSKPEEATKKEGVAYYYDNYFRKFIDKFFIGSNAVAGFMHLTAAASSYIPFLSDKTQKFFDYGAEFLSKTIIPINFFNNGVEALRHNRVMEAFGRFLGPGLVPFMPFTDISLAMGFSSAAAIMDESVEGEIGKSFSSWSDNISQFFGVSGKLFREMLGGTFEKKHVSAIAGYLMYGGAAFGLIFGHGTRNAMNRLGGFVRNLGGIMGDLALLFHPDPANKFVGATAGVASILDIIQRFIPSTEKKLTRCLVHLVTLCNDVALSYWATRSVKRTDDKVITYKGENAVTA